MDRPDYVPSTWRDDAGNRWVASKPSRVLAFFAFFVAMAVALLVWIATDPRSWLHHPGGFVVIPIGSAILFFQATKYGPRAWRARRRG